LKNEVGVIVCGDHIARASLQLLEEEIPSTTIVQYAPG
jgi:hypothetical protein